MMTKVDKPLEENTEKKSSVIGTECVKGQKGEEDPTCFPVISEKSESFSMVPVKSSVPSVSNVNETESVEEEEKVEEVPTYPSPRRKLKPGVWGLPDSDDSDYWTDEYFSAGEGQTVELGEVIANRVTKLDSQVSLIPEVQESPEVRVKVKSSSEVVYGLLDSGATSNFVAQSLVQRLNLEDLVKSAPPAVLKDARGGVSIIEEAVAIPATVELGSVKLEVILVCYVVNDLKRELYLGIPFIYRYEDVFKFKDLRKKKADKRFIEDESDALVLEKPEVKCELVNASRFNRDWKSAEVCGMITVKVSPTNEVEVSTLEANIPMDNVQDRKDQVLKQFGDVVTNEPPTKLPPNRNSAHQVELLPGSPPVHRSQYRLTYQEKQELDKQVKELLQQGFIRESSSPFNAPVLFVKKKDGTLRMCMDFRMLNNFTVKNRFPLPLIDDILDSIGDAKVFSKLDLMSGYFQIRMDEKDVAKTAFSTPYNHYEWMVMPFGLTNAPATFQAMMNKVLKDYIGKFVLVYLDDILIYSQNEDDHDHHLRLVLTRLRNAQLVAKQSKCELFFKQVNFLGFTVGENGIGTDPAKIEVVKNWVTPKDAKECASFLGLTGFYRRFVKDYSKVASPLLEFAAKKAKWSTEHDNAFRELKLRLTTAPMLVIPRLQEGYKFRVTTDASDFAVGFVLEQLKPDGKLLGVVAYGSKKLSGAQLRYPVREKEFLAVVQALHTWRSLLLWRSFLIRTDHHSLTYIKQQKEVNNGRLARWLDFLSQYEFDIEYFPGTSNSGADALSRKVYHKSDGVITVEGNSLEGTLSTLTINQELKKSIQDGYELCSFCVPIIKILKNNKPAPKELNNFIKHFKFQDGLIYYNTFQSGPFSRVLVPSDKLLREKLLSIAHDGVTSGHFGALRTYELAARLWYWPKLMRSVKSFINTCLVCQKSKTSNQLVQGLFTPITIPDGRWSSITMDFVTGIPPTKYGHDMILVIVDKFTKRAMFIPTVKTLSGEGCAKLFIKHYFRSHGVPSSIITDKDVRFMGAFWQTFHKMMGSSLLFSTTNHPQTDGQSERMIRVLNQLLRSYCQNKLSSWDQYLPMVEFAYNSTHQSSIKAVPFELDLGYIPTSPSYVTSWVGPRYSPSAEELMKTLKTTQLQVQDQLVLSQHSQEKHYNRQHRSHLYKVGDWILLNKDALTVSKTYTKIQPSFFGPYKLVKQLGDNAFEVDLPVTSKKDRTINAKWFKPFNERSSVYPKQPPRTHLEARVRINEIVSIAGFDYAKGIVTVSWQDCHPGHTSEIDYSLFDFADRSLKDTLLRNAQVFTSVAIPDVANSPSSIAIEEETRGRVPLERG